MEKTNPTDLPRVVIEYIDSVIKHMKYRKKVRREVKEELTDHFIDALTDCQTEEEKKTVAQELIAEFGNIKLLGRLLRRAKKRCRPLWRTMVIRGVQCISVLFLLSIVHFIWLSFAKPQIRIDYAERIAQLSQPVPDKGKNAAMWYQQAIEAYHKPEAL
ncbi:MAG: hypothetical protein ACYSO4_07920, partial [Planctomycetota bacterium]